MIRKTYRIRATLTLGAFHSVPVAVCSVVWDESHPNQQTRQPPVRSENCQCLMDKVGSPSYGHIFARNM